jgi:hypothetical protein
MRQAEERTDGLHAEINARTHDFVPAVNGCDEPSRITASARTAEGMCERGILREVCFDGFLLDRGWRLGEEVDDAGYFFDCWEWRLVEITMACRIGDDVPGFSIAHEMRFSANCNL